MSAASCVCEHRNHCTYTHAQTKIRTAGAVTPFSHLLVEPPPAAAPLDWRPWLLPRELRALYDEPSQPQNQQLLLESSP